MSSLFYYSSIKIDISSSQKKATIFGAVSGAVTFGIGQLFQPALQAAAGFSGAMMEAGLSVAQAGLHGYAQGILSLMQGGTFEQAFVAGALGSLGASSFIAAADSFSKSAVGTVLFGAVSGGIGSELSGGNFWQGVLIGGIVAGLNHVAHKPKTSFKVYDDDGNYVGKMRIEEYRTVKYDDGSMSTEIDLRFTPTKNSGYDSFQWIQTVFKNEYGKYTVFNDPLPRSSGHDSSPYYWNKTYQAEMYNAKTNTYRFYDSPRREVNSMYNAYWRGEVSLVGINSSGAHALSTFKWGFNYYQNNHYLSMPLMSISYSGRYKWLK